MKDEEMQDTVRQVWKKKYKKIKRKWRNCRERKTDPTDAFL